MPDDPHPGHTADRDPDLDARIAPLDLALRERIAALDAASVCDGAAAAGVAVGVPDPAIRLLSGAERMAGVARPAACDDDFLAVWWGIDRARAGEVLVISAGTRAVVGELFASEAARKHVAGIVVDGWCRDVAHLRRSALPVYARGTTPQAGSANVARPEPGAVEIGGVTVIAGDLVLGDADGVVVVPRAAVDAVVTAAEAVQRREAAMLETILAGGSVFAHTTLREHWPARLAGQASVLRVWGERDLRE